MTVPPRSGGGTVVEHRANRGPPTETVAFLARTTPRPFFGNALRPSNNAIQVPSNNAAPLRRAERQPVHVRDVPGRLVDDPLVVPAVEHGSDTLRVVDLRRDACALRVAGGCADRTGATRCHTKQHSTLAAGHDGRRVTVPTRSIDPPHLCRRKRRARPPRGSCSRAVPLGRNALDVCARVSCRR